MKNKFLNGETKLVTMKTIYLQVLDIVETEEGNFGMVVQTNLGLAITINKNGVFSYRPSLNNLVKVWRPRNSSFFHLLQPNYWHKQYKEDLVWEKEEEYSYKNALEDSVEKFEHITKNGLTSAKLPLYLQEYLPNIYKLKGYCGLCKYFRNNIGATKANCEGCFLDNIGQGCYLKNGYYRHWIDGSKEATYRLLFLLRDELEKISKEEKK